MPLIHKHASYWVEGFLTSDVTELVSNSDFFSLDINLFAMMMLTIFASHAMHAWQNLRWFNSDSFMTQCMTINQCSVACHSPTVFIIITHMCDLVVLIICTHAIIQNREKKDNCWKNWIEHMGKEFVDCFLSKSIT